MRIALFALLVCGSLALLWRRDQPPLCTTPPISIGDLNAAIAQDPKPFPENVLASGRQDVRPAEQRAIRRVLEQVVACSNAGEPLRVWSLHSADSLARLFRIQGPFDQATYDVYATPLPNGTGSGMRLQTVEDIWQRKDGIFGAEVLVTFPSVPMPKRIIYWLSASGDRWAIEEITGEISFSLP